MSLCEVVEMEKPRSEMDKARTLPVVIEASVVSAPIAHLDSRIVEAAALEFSAGVHLIEEMEKQVAAWEESESKREMAYKAFIISQRSFKSPIMLAF